MQKITKNDAFFRHETLFFMAMCVYICVTAFVYCIMGSYPKHADLISAIAFPTLFLSLVFFPSKTAKLSAIGNVINVAIVSVVTSSVIIKYSNESNIALIITITGVVWYMSLFFAEFNKKFIRRHKRMTNMIGLTVFISALIALFFNTTATNILLVIATIVFIINQHARSGLQNRDAKSTIDQSCQMIFLVISLFVNLMCLHGTLIA